jgi:thiol-disulfide isomerase/thioredoxin
LHALYAISLRKVWLGSSAFEALGLSKEYVARWPDDPWVQVAHGYVILSENRRDEALAAAARARELAPDDADIAGYVMDIYTATNRREQAVALADSFIAGGRATVGLRLRKASVLWQMAELPGISNTTAAVIAQQELDHALAETPPSAAAYFMAGERSRRDRRPADAFALLERAVELSPHSNPIRQAYWRSIGALPDISAEEKQAMIRADMDVYLDLRQHSVGARFTVANQLNALRDTDELTTMWDLIEREHAGTWQAGQAAFDRARLEAESALKMAATQTDSLAAKQQLYNKLYLITEMPGVNSGFVLIRVYNYLFHLLLQDSSTSADELLSVFEHMEEMGYHDWPSASVRHVELPLALAERGSRLDYAEQLARTGLEPLESEFIEISEYLTASQFANFLDQVTSTYHATIGWVLFHKGEIAEAKIELEKAYEAVNTSATPPYRLGRIAEAEGDIEAAESWYVKGRGRENLIWHNPLSSKALQRLYLINNESLDGFEEYLTAIDERDVARRRAKVASDRIAQPGPLPDFEHEWLNGGRFSSESLKGKIAVINFWGVWCGPCVREAPEIQQFAGNFRDHPDVVFLTVSSDNNPDTTRDFMKEKEYDFPVLINQGLSRMTNIRRWPTTLFVDREGQIVFIFEGATHRLVDEYTWRVEALLGFTDEAGN